MATNCTEQGVLLRVNLFKYFTVFLSLFLYFYFKYPLLHVNQGVTVCLCTGNEVNHGAFFGQKRWLKKQKLLVQEEQAKKKFFS